MIEKKISRNRESIAHFVIVNNSDYVNINNDVQIKYCDIFENKNKSTFNIKILLKSIKRQLFVRVIRLFAIKSTIYLLKKSFRYNELYNVIQHVFFDVNIVMYCFTLIRQRNQKTIRYIDENARFNVQKFKIYERLRQRFDFFV